ncbi:hypothetical protein D7B24_004777 [Verticillium nonalfalfae]|uniref:IDI-2 n=1 Tax=Verticillium nonalfalfae TaxID=1051616 RepID=A0A3M9YDT8_9PEZI|nr:uncharacterized protein D7B24_004777 [Verticillium nonalfalfae]RNJ58325.1 hypothetical protein D7B24_004777 [Verticillium nonalfalfae]
MKPAFLLAVVQATSVLAAAVTHAETTEKRALRLEQKCGILGVMEVPEGEDASEVRDCREHPTRLLQPGMNPGDAPLPTDYEESSDKSPSPQHRARSLLAKRACWFGKVVGCSKTGFCYRKCCDVDGPWCWTAKGREGLGGWWTCNSDRDCLMRDACGMSKAPLCKDCGCSC